MNVPNYEGYEQLVSLYHQMKEYSDTTVDLDFSSNRWFEANLLCSFGVDWSIDGKK